MKKALVILLALALVFGLVLTACDIGGGGGGGGKKPSPTPEVPGGELEWKVVFNMQDAPEGTVTHGIQALTAGAITFPESGDTPITPLVRAGGNDAITIEAVSQGGKIALQYTTIAGWGAGIDLNNDAFGFQVGDKITITGELIEGAKAQPNFSVGSENAYGFSVEAAGEFEWEIELTAAMLTAIRGGSPSAIRLEGRPAGVKVRIDNIVIEGNRPSTITKLSTPVIQLTEDEKGIQWTAVEGAGGYKVFADNGEDPITTVAASATSVNLYNVLTPDTYSITLVAAGVTGSTSDSDPSAPLTFVREPDSFTPPAGMIVLGAMDGLSPAETQGGWGIKAQAVEAGELPKYLVVQVDEGGDGLGGTKVILQSATLSWTEKAVSGDWTYDGSWAAPKKVFIFELLDEYSDYAGIGLTESYINVGLRMGAANTKITGDRIISGAIVFADTAAATKLAAVCIDANKVNSATNPGNFWFIDGEFGDIFD